MNWALNLVRLSNLIAPKKTKFSYVGILLEFFYFTKSYSKKIIMMDYYIQSYMWEKNDIKICIA